MENTTEASPSSSRKTAPEKTGLTVEQPKNSAMVQGNSFSEKVLSLAAGEKYYSLISKTEMVAKQRRHAMLAMGDCGIGKSTIIKNTLERLGQTEGKDFIFVRGYSTPFALYKILHENNEHKKIVIIDDCDSVLKNTTSLDILKAVLDDKFKRTVSYETMRKTEDLPKSFVFVGSVIFITNFRPKECDVHFLSIQDRCMVQKLYLNAQEKLEYIEEVIVPQDFKQSSLTDRKKIFSEMKDGVSKGGVDFSYRTFFQLLDFYQHDPRKFEIHLRELLPMDQEVSLILKSIKEHPKDPKQWMKNFMDATGKSRRSFFYAKKKALGINSKKPSEMSL